MDFKDMDFKEMADVIATAHCDVAGKKFFVRLKVSGLPYSGAPEPTNIIVVGVGESLALAKQDARGKLENHFNNILEQCNWLT